MPLFYSLRSISLVNKCLYFIHYGLSVYPRPVIKCLYLIHYSLSIYTGPVNKRLYFIHYSLSVYTHPSCPNHPMHVLNEVQLSKNFYQRKQISLQHGFQFGGTTLSLLITQLPQCCVFLFYFSSLLSALIMIPPSWLIGHKKQLPFLLVTT